MTAHPHTDQFDRDAIEDRGLIDNDNTEDMRRPPAATEGLSEVPTPHISR